MNDHRTLALELREFNEISRRIMDRLLKPDLLSLARIRLLEVVDRTPAARWSEIANVLGYSPRTITEAIDALERDGLVVRRSDAKDRRVKIISMTLKGQKAMAAARGHGDRFLSAAFGQLGDREHKQLAASLQKLLKGARAFEKQDLPEALS